MHGFAQEPMNTHQFAKVVQYTVRPLLVMHRVSLVLFSRILKFEMTPTDCKHSTTMSTKHLPSSGYAYVEGSLNLGFAFWASK